MSKTYLVRGTENVPYLVFNIPYWVELSEIGNKEYFHRGPRSDFHSVKDDLNDNDTYRQATSELPATFEQFVSQYVKTYYPKWKDAKRIKRLEGSYKAITHSSGIKTIGPVSHNPGIELSQCISIWGLFNQIISENTIHFIDDLRQARAIKMGDAVHLPGVGFPFDPHNEIFHRFTPEEYLAYVFKRALEFDLPFDYGEALKRFVDNPPDEVIAMYEKPDYVDLKQEYKRVLYMRKYLTIIKGNTFNID